jgi:glycosyltransferase involved in cell wall biosynthesis
VKDIEKRLQISVVVPVYNGARTIARTVECLLRQSLAPAEIIIIDDGSTDGTRQALEKFSGQIRVRTQTNSGPASARNSGVRLATGDLVAFTDSDCLPDEDWLEKLSSGFDSPPVAGVGGAVRSAIRGMTGEYVDAIGLLDPGRDREDAIPYLITANACFRREVLIKAGLFDERFRRPGGEEPDLCLRIRRMGYRFRFSKQALVRHYHRDNIVSFLKTIANYGEGSYVLGGLWPEYRIDKPVKRLLRRSVELKSLVSRVSVYASRYGFFKSVYFSLLDYLRQIAFLSGYLRGRRREA